MGTVTVLWSGLDRSVIEAPLQDALKWEGDEFEALTCVELVLEFHPKGKTPGGKKDLFSILKVKSSLINIKLRLNAQKSTH